MWPLVIALGAGVGLLARPLVQNLLGGNNKTITDNYKQTAQCAGPSGSELALTESIAPNTQTSSNPADLKKIARRYSLARPGQPPLVFENAGDDSLTPLDCKNVLFGPGPRIAFAQATQATVLELVGPNVREYDAQNQPDLVKLTLEPRWKLGLKISDYTANAPVINETGKIGKLVLQRKSPSAGMPQQFVLNTQDGGASYSFDPKSIQ